MAILDALCSYPNSRAVSQVDSPSTVSIEWSLYFQSTERFDEVNSNIYAHVGRQSELIMQGNDKDNQGVCFARTSAPDWRVGIYVLVANLWLPRQGSGRKGKISWRLKEPRNTLSAGHIYSPTPALRLF